MTKAALFRLAANRQAATESDIDSGRVNKHMKELPDWARWIAMDADGACWCYEAEPHRHDRGWYENEVGRSQRIERQPVDDWEASLERLPDCR